MTQQKNPLRPILVVDDEPGLLLSLKGALRQSGFNHVITCDDSRQVKDLVTTRDIGLLLLDLYMPNVSGEEILEDLMLEFPDLPVIIITGVMEVETAIRCMRKGAFDYLTKPVDEGTLTAAVKRALHIKELKQENQELKKHLFTNRLEHPEDFSGIVTNNAGMLTLFQYIESIAPSSQPVLITGETGTGKELMARAIHKQSRRRGAFAVVNVAGLDDNVFSDTLFGHSKGAFTGADHDRRGMLENAAGGTLVLDEIGDLSPASQVKLLRLLQNNEYLPLGEDQPRFSDARIIAVTNQDLWQLQRSSNFRKDLNFRLRTHTLHLPPLRERIDDLPLLIDHFLETAATALGKRKATPPKELLTLLRTHAFPGNVRELESMIFDAVSRHRAGVLSLDTFKQHMDETIHAGHTGDPEATDSEAIVYPSSLPTIKAATHMLVAEALRRTDGNRSIAARILGISPQALGKRLKKAAAEEGSP